MNNKAYYITTPIYYVNGEPHLGTVYTSIAADVLARFYRLDGRQVTFLTGTDEHGQKVEKSAEKAGLSPQAFADQVSERFRALSKAYNLSEDIFIRTTEERHKKSAQHLWKKMSENGDIYESSFAGWYAMRDEAFYAESELIDGKAPNGAEVEWVEEPSYFFKLSDWQESLLQYYRQNPDFIAPESRRNEVMRFVENGLHDLSISRSTFNWGVPVPGNEKHVMYVWVDALANYITALGYPDSECSEFKAYWPEAIHLVGKDILRFHAVYWPAFLMAAGLTPPKRIFAHGWWTHEGQKMSKSLGNTIDPFALAECFGADQVRYFMMREIPFGGDGDFSEAALIKRTNADLANDFGNLCQRVLSFVYRNAGAKIPQPGPLTSPDQALLDQAHTLVEIVRKYAEVQALSKMCETIWVLVGEANRYIDSEQPWSLRKTDSTRMETVLYVLMNVIRHLAVVASPIIPKAASQILNFLSVPEDQRDFHALKNWELTPRTVLPEPQGVFPRIVETPKWN
ncbi:MAG: methionine--tRNA ligase [Alphaproteobacteria bacterium]|nr:methionine--tRNA ligase [Alphaproteobacteria bacterium]